MKWINYTVSTSCNYFSHGEISNEGSAVKDLGFLHHHLREDVDRVTGDSSIVTVTCYATGLTVKQKQTMPELLELLGQFPILLRRKWQGKGVPLKVRITLC